MADILKNQQVIHKVFGRGIITEQNDGYITIRFSDKPRRFVAPDAFMTFLKCEDVNLQKELELECIRNKEIEEQKELEKREAQRKAAEEAKLRESAKNIIKKRKKQFVDHHSNENNLAFKCNFCDGGCSNVCLGYKGVCSDEQIRYNIEKKNRAWCSDEKDSFCFKYYKGLITRNELEEQNKRKPVCYESRMLIDWKAEAGEDRNGIDGPKARRISNASKNSLAVLTAELPDMEGGKERVIFGVFITGVVDEGDDIQAGYVKAYGDYHIELTPEECKQMKFWHYHLNPNNPERIQWGTGLYRYMKDTVCARILVDILEIKKGTPEKEKAKEMLEYYCNIKGIDINNIPDANGAI